MRQPRLTVALLLLWPTLAAAISLRPVGLRSDGTWLRDRAGRVVLLRGMNYSGLEFGNFPGRPHGPEEADFAQMASWGVNVIRLPIAWHYLEPSPGVFDPGHLRDVVDPVVRWARRHDIAVVIELHQFMWSPCIRGGNGVPAWTCAGKGYSNDASGALQAEHDFWNGATAPDGTLLVDHLLDAWRLVARHYRGSTVVGLDFLNEPLDIQNPDFEHDALYPFYRRAIDVVRRAGARQVIFLEPPVSRNLRIRAHPEPVGDTNLTYGPHLYTTTFGLPDLKYNGNRAILIADYDQAMVEAAEQGAVLWVGEFGGSTAAADGFLAATELFLTHSLAEQEARRVGSGFWAYFPSDNIFSLVDANGAEKGRLVDIFARAYPMATAGIPRTIAWDPDARTFDFTFDEDAAAHDPTIIWVPSARHYPRGFIIDTSPGVRAVFDARRSVLVVRRRDRSEALHEVHLRPVP